MSSRICDRFRERWGPNFGKQQYFTLTFRWTPSLWPPTAAPTPRKTAATSRLFADSYFSTQASARGQDNRSLVAYVYSKCVCRNVRVYAEAIYTPPTLPMWWNSTNQTFWWFVGYVYVRQKMQGESFLVSINLATPQITVINSIFH